MNDKKIEPKVSVTLTDNTHSHAGEQCKKGDVIELRKSQADKLVELKKAETVKGE